MKNDLPNLYRGNISTGASNNKHVAHGFKENFNPKDTINKLFKANQIYREDVELTTKDKVLNTKIIGRTQDHIITIDNVVIKIDDILDIKVLK